jgi:hypothetical protein
VPQKIVPLSFIAPQTAQYELAGADMGELQSLQNLLLSLFVAPQCGQ